jgi:hypothetical protein
MSKIFDATLKKTIFFGLLVIVLMLVLGGAALIKLIDATAAVDTMIGLLGAYGIYLVVSYSEKLMNYVSKSYPKKVAKCRFLVNMGVSIIVTVVFMFIFALAPVLVEWIALQLGVSIPALSTTTLGAIYGAMIAGMVFYWFESLVSLCF